MKPEIRELGAPEEVRSCAELLRLAFGTVAREFGLTEQTAPTNAAFTTTESLRRHLQDGMRLYGMFLGSALAGCVAVKKAKAKDRLFYIERLAVAPESRHRGHGGELLSFAIDRIREQGGTTASVGLIDDNERLKAWYRSKGFAQHDRRRIAHLPFKVCFMSRELAPR